MRPFSRAARILSFAVSSVALVSVAQADTEASKQSAPTLLQQMVGTWKVQQRMWPGPGAEAVNLPPAVARRHLKAGGFLEEVMEAIEKSGSKSFTRTAYFNYNAVNQQFEYFSLDSRAPQMMNERSDETEQQGNPGKDGIKLSGGSFVAPQWGEAKNMAFTYRLVVGGIENNSSQRVQLYLTPQAGDSPKEFLAFEYVYTRQR